jgi:hypothetical protein
MIVNDRFLNDLYVAILGALKPDALVDGYRCDPKVFSPKGRAPLVLH